jgi:hypothetical protein
MTSEGIQLVVLAAGDGDAIFKLIVPIVIAIFYILAAIGKAKKGNEQQESEEEEQEQRPQPPAQRPPQQSRPQPMRTPAPMPQRPVAQQAPKPMQPGQPRPVPRPMPQRSAGQVPQPRPAPTERHPREVFDRVTKPISTAGPASVERLEERLQEKAKRAEREPERVMHAEHVVDMALKPTIIPTAEVAEVQSLEEVDLGEVQINLRHLHKVREAIILKEILDKPLALR